MRKGPTGNSITSRSEPEHILILAPNWLGDAVMALPFMEAAAKRYESASVAIGCLDYVAPLFERAGIEAGIITWTREDGVWTRAATIVRERPETGWDAVFILPPSFSSALTALMTRSKDRLGYATDGRRNLLTKSIHRRELKKRHLSDSYMALLKLLPGSKKVETPPAILTRSHRWKETLESAGITGKYFVIAPGATYGTAKMWPMNRYSSIIEAISGETGQLPVIIGSENERQVAEDIMEGSGRACVMMAGKASIGEMIDIVGGASLFIGNDSGPAHISAALGIPTVTLFGSTSPDWTAPRGAGVKVLYSALDCSPCFKRECPLGTLQCLKDITIESVLDAAADLMSGDSGLC